MINTSISCHGIPFVTLPEEKGKTWLKEIEKLTFSREEITDSSKSDMAIWHGFQQKAKHIAFINSSPEIYESLFWLMQPKGIDAVVIGDLPHNCPLNYDKQNRASIVPETVLTGLIANAGGNIFGYRQEQSGKRFHRIIPIYGKENTQSNAGQVKFNWHTDNFCFLPSYRAEYLALIGVSNEPRAATLILLLEKDILPRIPRSLLESLRKPIFQATNPQSFEFGGCLVLTEPRPIIYDDEFGHPNIALPPSIFPQATEEAQNALQEFREFLDTLPPRAIVIDESRALFFNNSRVLHSRDAFEGWRELVRAYFSRSLEPFFEATGCSRDENIFDARPLLLK